MKVTDVFTLFHKSKPSLSSSAQGDGVKPVSVIDKMSLQPGQLLRGEVLGEDGKGNLLLKIGNEIISTRSLVSMMTGQQVWVEVKDVGDSPLFALAQAKGAVHDLLKNIMDVRPVVLAQGAGDVVVSPEFQTVPVQSTDISFVPTLVPVYEDGGLPRETIQFLKALMALPEAEVPSLPEPKMQQLLLFLAPETGRVDIGRLVTELNRTGKVPVVLSEFELMRPLFVFGGDTEQAVSGLSHDVEFTSSQGEPDLVFAGKGGSASVPVITTDGQVIAHTVQVVRALIDSVAVMQNTDGQQDVQAAEVLSKGFTDLVKSILGESRIPDSLCRFEPIRQLLENSMPGFTKNSGFIQAVTADELIQGFGKTSIQSQVLSPDLHNETVVRILSGLQDAEPKPELLKVLKQLVSFAQFAVAVEDENVRDDEHFARMGDAATGVAKAASFFKSQALVNHEVAHVVQGDCVLVPCFFAGQSGWGEWLWSHEQKEGEGQQTQENLAFFLEMSNLGPVSIQVVLGSLSLTGQFRVADDRAYELLVQGLPVLQERLNVLGYEAHLTCQQQPVAVIQEIKDSLERRTSVSDSAPVSLVDIQA